MSRVKYVLYDCYTQQFEALVIAICSKILGVGIQHFSTGKDGGRDAKFIGKATSYPSKSEPASGKFIVQAKHTESPIAKFSDTDFYDGKKSILNDEIPRMRKLYNAGEIDHYLLFSNRRLSANTNAAVSKWLSKETAIQKVHLVGLEMIEWYLDNYPKIVKQANINFVDEPLRISPDDLAEIVKSFYENKNNIKQDFDSIHNFKYIRLDSKNSINGLTEGYFNLIKSNYMPNFNEISIFLADPKNDIYKTYYHETADDLNASIIAKRNDFSSFDDVLEYIYKRLIERDGDLKKRKALTRTFLYYMYCNCDIGKKQ